MPAPPAPYADAPDAPWTALESTYLYLSHHDGYARIAPLSISLSNPYLPLALADEKNATSQVEGGAISDCKNPQKWGHFSVPYSVVVNKACHVAVGVDVEGRKQVLGLWLGAQEGAKFWANVLTQVRNRGVKDILILCCDGLTGLPAAVNSIYPETVVQTCVVHLLRSAMRYASYKDRKSMAKDMRPIYTAASVEAAELAMEHFAEVWQSKAPGGGDGVAERVGGLHPIPGI